MLSSHFLLKLLLTPLIIITATLVARRWGDHIGGLIIGLPLTSAPVSIFFAIEQGRNFAGQAAKSAILGLVPVAVFCCAYIWSAKRFPWFLAPLFGISLYLVAVWSISLVSPDLGLTTGLVALALILAILYVGKADFAAGKISPPWWDLPLRIVIATTLLLLITGAAASLGPIWGGLLSPFPIFTFVMATFSHRQGGSRAAWNLIRGVLTGLFAYAAFFLVVALMIEHASLPVVYLLAALAALSLNSLSLGFMLWKRRSVSFS
jgi:hypothetical protein